MNELDKKILFENVNSNTINDIDWLDKQLFLDDYYDLSNWKNMFENLDYEIKTLYIENEIAGFLCLFHAIDETEIIRIGVNSKFQGMGLGKYLMNYAIDNYDNLLLEVSSINQKALNLYLKLGFEIINVRSKYYENGSNAIIMRRIKLER